MDAKTAAAKVQNGLQDLSDKELVEIYSALKDNAEYKTQFNKLMHVAGSRLEAILEADGNNGNQNIRGGAAKVDSDEEALVRDNLKQIETLSKVDPLNAENKDFAASRKYLGNLEVVNENGQKIDVAPNIIEIAKLKTTSELYNTTEPLTQESYNRRLRDNIDLSIYGIMATNNWVKGSTSAAQTKDNLLSILAGQKQSVSTAAVSGVMAAQVVSLSNFADKLADKFKKLSLASRFKDKVAAANANLKNKLKETYIKARTYSQILAEQGVYKDVGMAFVAGLGGPAGMAAFGAWTYYRRVHPMVKAYREEARVNPQMKNFWQYMKEHKKDTLMAGLYMGSSVASFAIAGAQVASAITLSSTVAQAGAASIAPLTQAKALTAAGVVLARGATDIAQAWDNPEERGKAVKRAIFSLGMYGVGYEIADHLAQSHHDTVSTPVSEQPASENVTPMLDENHNGISDYIERPAEETAPLFKPLPWQDNNVAAADTAAVNSAPEAVAGEDVAASAHEYTVGAREQAVYVRNLRIVQDSDLMVANVNDDIVKLPEGMTPEMAVNLGRVNLLYYGDDTALKLLRDCDEVRNISSVEYFSRLADKFTDSVQDPHGVGFPKDPNYGYTDPNIYTRSVHVDCDKTTIIPGRIGGHVPPVTTPVEPANPTAPVQNLPPIEPTPVTLRVDPTPIPPHIDPVSVDQPTVTAPEAPRELEQPVLKGVGGNGPLDENINSEGARLNTNVGVDGEGNVVRVDSRQNFSADQGQGGTATRSADTGVKTGKGSEELNQALLNKKFNTFNL